MDTNGHTLGNAHGAIFPRSRDKDSGLPEEESPDVVGGQVPQFSQFPRAEMPLEYLRRVGSRFHHAITFSRHRTEGQLVNAYNDRLRGRPGDGRRWRHPHRDRGQGLSLQQQMKVDIEPAAGNLL